MSLDASMKAAMAEAVAPLVKMLADLQSKIDALTPVQPDGEFGLEGLGRYLPEGQSTEPAAMRMWLSRNRDFPRRREGRRLVFRRSEVLAWLGAHGLEPRGKA